MWLLKWSRGREQSSGNSWENEASVPNLRDISPYSRFFYIFPRFRVFITDKLQNSASHIITITKLHFDLNSFTEASCFSLPPFTFCPLLLLIFPSSLSPSGLLCFISDLINSSEVRSFALNPHLPVHMATGWPPSHTRLQLRDRYRPMQPPTNSFTWIILTHTKGILHGHSSDDCRKIWLYVVSVAF